MSKGPGRIPIDDAKRIAVERRCPVVVVFGIHEDNTFTVASYGMTRKLCKVGAGYADAIADSVLSGLVRAPESEPPDAAEVRAAEADAYRRGWQAGRERCVRRIEDLQTEHESEGFRHRRGSSEADHHLSKADNFGEAAAALRALPAEAEAGGGA